MTPKEQATEIYERMLNISHDMSPEHARRAAIIAADFMIDTCNFLYIEHYIEIKLELEKWQ